MRANCPKCVLTLQWKRPPPDGERAWCPFCATELIEGKAGVVIRKTPVFYKMANHASADVNRHNRRWVAPAVSETAAIARKPRAVSEPRILPTTWAVGTVVRFLWGEQEMVGAVKGGSVESGYTIECRGGVHHWVPANRVMGEGRFVQPPPTAAGLKFDASAKRLLAKERKRRKKRLGR